MTASNKFSHYLSADHKPSIYGWSSRNKTICGKYVGVMSLRPDEKDIDPKYAYMLAPECPKCAALRLIAQTATVEGR